MCMSYSYVSTTYVIFLFSKTYVKVLWFHNCKVVIGCYSRINPSSTILDAGRPQDQWFPQYIASPSSPNNLEYLPKRILVFILDVFILGAVTVDT